jgi:hypothetical protein
MGIGWAPAIPAVKQDKNRITQLISQLASRKFSDRRQASQELDAIGEPALEALRKARSDADPETCRRAKELVAKIEERLDTAAVLAPTRVHLVCKDMPVREAVAELARKAKFEILIDPASKAKLAQRRVTLDTGEVTFWEAFDALCLKAGLVETAWQNPAPRTWDLERPVVQPAVIKKLLVPARLPAKLLPPPKPKGLQVRPPQPKPVQPQLKAPKKVQAQPQKLRQAKGQPQKLKPAVVQAAKRAAARQLVALAQVQQAQVQIQQLVQVRQALILSDISYSGVQPSVDHSRIVLADGKPERVPTYYAGAFRIRARTTPGKDKQSALTTLDVSAEPRHLGWNFVGSARLVKATDDRGQALALLEEQRPNDLVMNQWAVQGRLVAQIELVYYNGRGPSSPFKRTIQIQLRRGEAPAKRMQIAGRFLVETKTEVQPLIVVDKILTAAGKTIRGHRGGSIQVIEVAKGKDGNHRYRFKLEAPPHCSSSTANPLPAIAVVNPQGGMGRPALPTGGNIVLVDSKGAPFPLISSSVTNTNGDVVQTLTFRAQQGREPARLVFSAQRTVTVHVPFTFKQLPLP